jgi:hypothetical protein
MRIPSRASLAGVSLVCALGAAAAPARADGALPSAATPVQREQAQAKFLRGKELFGRKQFEAALDEFRGSIEIVASPNTRLQIARTLRALARYVAAYAELGRTLVEAKELSAQDSRYQRAYEAATQERSELEPLLGFVALTVENPAEGTRVLVGTEEIRRAAWSEPVPIFGGKAEISVETPGHAAVKSAVTVAPGAKTALTVDAQSGAPVAGEAPAPVAEAPAPPPPAPAPEPRRLEALRPWAYVAGGVGVIGLGTFAIFGAMASSTFNDLQSACGGGPCPASKSDEISSGKTQQVVANVGLAVGLVGAAAGGALFVLSMPKKAPAPSAALVVGPAWIGVQGSL